MRRSIAHKVIACGLVLLLIAPLERVATAQQPEQMETSSSSLPQAPLPSTDRNATEQNTTDQNTTGQNAPGQKASGQSTPDRNAPGVQAMQDQQPANQAVGTAAAPYEKTTSIAATRPAGAVIAPAKQRRIRSILIKVGIVAGAGAAIAAVALLSHSSPSEPH